MRFSFPLQTLLNWKRNLEEFSQMRLAEKITRLKRQEEEIRSLTLKRLAYGRELEEKSQQGLKADEYGIYKQFAEDSGTELEQRDARKEKTLQEIEAERRNLLSLTKERKILERLKEKRFKSFKYEAEKSEQKNIDEMAVMKYPRRNPN